MPINVNPDEAARHLSRLLFEARELIEMAADFTESRTGHPDAWARRVLADIDAYRADRGWSPHGFGGEAPDRDGQPLPPPIRDGE